MVGCFPCSSTEAEKKAIYLAQMTVVKLDSLDNGWDGNKCIELSNQYLPGWITNYMALPVGAAAVSVLSRMSDVVIMPLALYMIHNQSMNTGLDAWLGQRLT